ncbi:hypothetical protein VNO78_23416 [Psophocarpus tetragonolobus]|uniref:RNase H type-1 domain-containing protein n=1 Tax=Psophocarpus tetragonolobus TaxID=3891 RepID=A0AAN9S342_PSOTE
MRNPPLMQFNLSMMEIMDHEESKIQNASHVDRGSKRTFECRGLLLGILMRERLQSGSRIGLVDAAFVKSCPLLIVIPMIVGSERKLTRCSSSEEHPLHCFKDYPHSLEIWMRLGFGEAEFYHSTVLADWLKHNSLRNYVTLFDTLLDPLPSPEIIKGLSRFAAIGEALRPEFIAVSQGLHIAWNRCLRDLIIESDSLKVIHCLNNGFADTNVPYLDLISSIQKRVRHN